MRDESTPESDDPYPEGVDGPSVSVPSVSGPSIDASEASLADVGDSRLARLFVLQVLVWNAVLLSVSLGAMLIYFRNDWTTGRRLIGVGAVLVVYSAYRWPDRAADERDGSQ